ncbi:uncharacterized protein LOC143879415 [Tasmannia lanceolata]|uniref:uncharacterized protein LOC143879415 n=1 Tax=Tasmannia lanceolata TaxID=3420 RepID=UPI004064B303
MGSDSMTNPSSVSAFARDIGKKKRTNRSAKLKQWKLDARREQWLSQVKNKSGVESESESNVGSFPPPTMPMTNGQNQSLGNLETRSRADEHEGLGLHYSDTESPMTSPTSSISGNVSRKEHPSTSSNSSIGCFSGNVSEEEEEEENGSLDDWEAVADALTAENSESPKTTKNNTVESTDPSKSPNNTCSIGVLKSERKGNIPRAITTTSTMNCRAWRPDDTFRPQSLPNLSKQLSFPMNGNRHCGGGPANWRYRGMISQPSSCPICYEDLDSTDSSFLPCLCGFRLCLFCHKRILEADGRCPGCRKQYCTTEGEVGMNGRGPPFWLARSFSMNLRS